MMKRFRAGFRRSASDFTPTRWRKPACCSTPWAVMWPTMTWKATINRPRKLRLYLPAMPRRLQVHQHVPQQRKLLEQPILYVVPDGVPLGDAHLGIDLDVHVGEEFQP